MMEKLLDSAQLKQLQDMIAGARKMVAVCHVNPDGDALGSTLAVQHWMRRLGKECTVVAPNNFPDFLAWMPGADGIVRFDKKPDVVKALMAEAELVWVCDLNEPSRVLDMEETLRSCTAKKVMIDHHLNPDGFCDLTVSHPEMSATCELMCHIMFQMGELQRAGLEEATCLYTGMMTDTGAFTFNSNRPVVFECIGHLLERGADKDRIYRNVFWTASIARMRVTGYLLYVKLETMPEQHAAIMSLDNKERKMLGVKNGDTEGIVNMPLQVLGMQVSAFLSQDTEHPERIKISLRSVDDFACNELSARYFNGGGHKNAAGGHLICSMDEAVEKMKEAIVEFQKQRLNSTTK